MAAGLWKAVLFLLSYPPVSNIAGAAARLTYPKWLVRLVVKKYFIDKLGVNIAEAERPWTTYPSVLAFFTRKLKKGARGIAAGAQTIISPVDARLASFGKITNAQALQAKGKPYFIADLLGEENVDFKDGWFCTLYLSPADYHRIHHPADAVLQRAEYFPGALLPVNDKSVQAFKKVFTGNRRLALQYRRGNVKYFMSLIGALNVGRIVLSFDPDFYKKMKRVKGKGMRSACTYASKVKKGSEAGMFELGSTAVLIFPAKTFTPAANLKPGMKLKLGEKIGTLRLT